MATRSEPLTYDDFLRNHSAGLKALGFDEQFACFVYHLLEMKAGDTISYEKEDDVAIKRKNGNIELIQVKNSVDGTKSKMTDADGDFWKTLKLWVDGYNRYTEKDKKEYFQKRQFIIATNRTVANGFYDEIVRFQKQQAFLDDLRKWLNGFSSKTIEIMEARKVVIALKDEELRDFALSIKIDIYEDWTYEMYETALVNMQNHVMTDEILCELIGRLQENKKEAILDNGYFELSKKDFITRYKSTLSKMSIKPLLQVTEYDEEHWSHPAVIEDTNMIKQLCDIGELEKGSVSEKTYHYLYQCQYYKNNIQHFRDMELMDDEIQSRLESEAKRKWNLQFGRHESLARHKSEDKKREEAVLCFHDTMEKTIDQYDENFSGGCYLKLSDENPPKIGWHIDWKTMY